MDTARFVGTSRYQVVRSLGDGDSGLVYEAMDHRRGSLVALKALPDLTSDALLSLKQEFRSLSDLSHPSLMALFELVGSDTGWFIAMEHVRGTDLLTHVRRTDAPLETASTVEVDLPPDAVPTALPTDSVPTTDGQAPLAADLGRLRDSFAQLLSAVGALPGITQWMKSSLPTKIEASAIAAQMIPAPLPEDPRA